MAKIRVETTINGEEAEFLCHGQNSLLEVLRDTLSMTGTKEGCTTGDCGACSVVVDAASSPPVWCWPRKLKGALSKRSRAWRTARS